jgi:autophagy-related protein 17
VEASFRPPNDPPKHLFDFVDEAGISELENSVKESMDRFEAARSNLVNTCEDFEKDLQRLHQGLQAPEEEEEEGRFHAVDGISPVPGLFYALENHATEAATHLEGLVKHYDLCVTALKHTEGGGEAISQASDSEQDQQASALAGLGVDLGKHDGAPLQPLGEQERTDMLAVLVKDAAEVEDVVSEIKERLSEMEDQLVQIDSFMQSLRDASSRLRQTLALLKQTKLNVPGYIAACSDFQAAWEEEKAILGEKMEGLEGLRDFYSGFSEAYDDLIIEVQRRKLVKHSMEKVISSAMAELDKLHKGITSLHPKWLTRFHTRRC